MNVRYVQADRQHLGCLIALGALLLANVAQGEAPRIDAVFPAGAQAGQSVEISITGAAQRLLCSAPGAACERIAANRFRVTVPRNTTPGLYELWATTDEGLSAPRTFAISNRSELLEVEPNDDVPSAQQIALDTFSHGSIEEKGDRDYYQFAARSGQRVIIECWAERLDSRLRAILELYDAAGRRLAVNRGYFDVDPMIDFTVPADGTYVVRIQDLISSGSAEHYYRLDIDTGPRVAFAMPPVIDRETTRVTLFGWNLSHGDSTSAPAAAPSGTRDAGQLDQVIVEIPAQHVRATWPLPVPRHVLPAQAPLEGFAYHLPGSHAPVILGVSDVPVVMEATAHASPERAQAIQHPCVVSGQLTEGDECDWYAIEALRGEVLYCEALGQRMHSPVDLEIAVYDAAGERRLERWTDEARNVGGPSLPTAHLDPGGRWVAPADGRYLLAVRNVIGGIHADPRRIYQLSVRREEPDYQLLVTPQNTTSGGLTIPAGGSAALEVVALRRRGMHEAIEITAEQLPAGVTCAPLWLGPGVERGLLVASAAADAPPLVEPLVLIGRAELAGQRSVYPASVVRSGVPTVRSRLTSQLPLAIAGTASLRIAADAYRPVEHQLYGTLAMRYAPGSIVDVVVRIERDADHRAPVKLIGAGLPPGIGNQTTIVPAEADEGYLSFYLPPHLEVGRYSFTIMAEATRAQENSSPTTVTAMSSPVTIDVEPAAFLLEIDPYAPQRVKRGETFQVNYTAQRLNGFIGKIHTELAAPGIVTDVPGLRGRGETFVGQTDRGSLQIIVNPDAPLGPQPFVRLFSVGVVEDEARFLGARFLALEIVE